MTTNAGAEIAALASIGCTYKDYLFDATEVTKQSFMQEFRNCLDAIIQFSSLSHESTKVIVDKFFIELQV